LRETIFAAARRHAAPLVLPARINKNAPGQFTKNRGKFKLALAQFGVDEKVCGGIGRNPFPIPAKNV
jgi:hypothetical protein